MEKVDLAGQVVAVDTASKMYGRADLVVAHHASFDRSFVVQLVPQAAKVPWLCSYTQLPWRRWGHPSAALGSLLRDHGRFTLGAHRAGPDAAALTTILATPPELVGRSESYLLSLLRDLAEPARLIAVEGTVIAAKDALRAREYRWEPDRRFWHKLVVGDAAYADEVEFAAELVGLAGGRVLVGEVPPVKRFEAGFVPALVPVRKADAA